MALSEFKIGSGARVAAAATLLLAVALGGCSFKESFAPQKRTLSEFDLKTPRPLVLPPNYDLKPPAPGDKAATPPPSAAAQQTIYGSPPPAQPAAQPAAVAPASQGENALLQRAGAQNASPDIRQQVNSETSAVTDRGPGMTDRVLDYTPPADANGQAAPASGAADTTPAPTGEAAPADAQ
jgi:hypothetical protein